MIIVCLVPTVEGPSSSFWPPLLSEAWTRFDIVIMGERVQRGLVREFGTGMRHAPEIHHAAPLPGFKLYSRLWPAKHI